MTLLGPEAAIISQALAAVQSWSSRHHKSNPRRIRLSFTLVGALAAGSVRPTGFGLQLSMKSAAAAPVGLKSRISNPVGLQHCLYEMVSSKATSIVAMTSSWISPARPVRFMASIYLRIKSEQKCSFSNTDFMPKKGKPLSGLTPGVSAAYTSRIATNS